MSSSRTYRLGVWPGDGIGREVTAATFQVLQVASKRHGFSLATTDLPWGGEYYFAHGKVVPDDYLKTLAGFDAIYLGALGNPTKIPDHLSLRPLIEMRQHFDQYACLRPASLLPGVRTPLADKGPGDIDILVLRENSEGEYVSAGGAFRPKRDEEVVIQTAFHSRRGIARILRYGFELARQRRRHLTMATKSNALAYSMVLWDDVLDAVRGDYPDIECDKVHIDALSMNFVRCPEKYDVVVGSNLFGDILSDLGGAICGSLGLAPSANINPERDNPSLFEPVHGSAPDIYGQGIANPIAAIRSGAMMLDFLGEAEAAQAIDTAVRANLADAKVRTPDLGGTAKGADVANDIAQRLA